MAARNVWTGSISFGLVSVPVGLQSAASESSIRFNQLSGKTGSRVRQKRVDEHTGDEVPYEDIIKGYQITPDRYVVVSPEELAALDPKKTRTIEIAQFVDWDELDPVALGTPYRVVPGAGGERAHELLLEAMNRAGRAALGRIVIRTKERMAVIRATPRGLTLWTTLYPDEVREEPPLEPEGGYSPAELDMAMRLVEASTRPFEPGDWRDEYRERVLDLIERKANGDEVVGAPAEEPGESPADLMTALEASLDAVRGPAPRVPDAAPEAERAA